MTLAPAVHPEIRGIDGAPRQVERTCACPGCISLSQQAHHVWSRSYLRGQPYDWVQLPSGRIVSNRIGLCMRHHQDVTGDIGGHRAMIRLEPDETFIWLVFDAEMEWRHEGLLSPQPYSETPVEIPVERKHHAHSSLEEGETCESCGYTRPRKAAAGPKRKSKSYTVRIPDDSEIGSEVLDEWVAQFGVILGFEEETSKSLLRYHVLAVVLAWAMQHREEFISDIKEASEA